MKIRLQTELILPHDTYLINLGQPDAEKRKRSLAAFIDELKRCDALGLVKLNFHPGSHLKEVTLEEDLKLIAASVREAVDTVPNVCAVFENTAGQGTNVGFAFEQIAAMLELTDRPGRVGVCLDTCHTYAAGYDLATPEGYEKTFSEFERLIGFEYLQGMHLNDSKSVLGGRLDRHNSIGKGELGLDFFRRAAGGRAIRRHPAHPRDAGRNALGEGDRVAERVRGGRVMRALRQIRRPCQRAFFRYQRDAASMTKL